MGSSMGGRDYGQGQDIRVVCTLNKFHKQKPKLVILPLMENLRSGRGKILQCLCYSKTNIGMNQSFTILHGQFLKY